MHYLHNEFSQFGEVFPFKFRVAHPQFVSIWIQPFSVSIIRKKTMDICMCQY